MKTRKTLQSGSSLPPSEEDNVLAIIIQCPECSTQRAFKINDNLDMVIKRQTSGIAIVTWCEECDRRIAFQLAWTKRSPGWTSKKIEMTDYMTVEDDIGMAKSK